MTQWNTSEQHVVPLNCSREEGLRGSEEIMGQTDWCWAPQPCPRVHGLESPTSLWWLQSPDLLGAESGSWRWSPGGGVALTSLPLSPGHSGNWMVFQLSQQCWWVFLGSLGQASCLPGQTGFCVNLVMGLNALHLRSCVIFQPGIVGPCGQAGLWRRAPAPNNAFFTQLTSFAFLWPGGRGVVWTLRGWPKDSGAGVG